MIKKLNINDVESLIPFLQEREEDQTKWEEILNSYIAPLQNNIYITPYGIISFAFVDNIMIYTTELTETELSFIEGIIERNGEDFLSVMDEINDEELYTEDFTLTQSYFIIKDKHYKYNKDKERPLK